MPKRSAERVDYGEDENQFFELWLPGQQAEGFAIFIHGGFWRAKYDLHHTDPFCAALVETGIAVASLEYRRIGQLGGGWPGTFEDILSGVGTVITHVGKLPVLVGHSAGGHLALRVASEPIPVKAVVALAPVADLRLAHKLNLSNGAVGEFMGGTPESAPECYDEACPSAHALPVPTFVVHGSDDGDVPIAISRQFVESRKKDPEPPSLTELPATGHMELIDPETSAGKTVLDLVARVARE